MICTGLGFYAIASDVFDIRNFFKFSIIHSISTIVRVNSGDCLSYRKRLSSIFYHGLPASIFNFYCKSHFSHPTLD